MQPSTKILTSRRSLPSDFAPTRTTGATDTTPRTTNVVPTTRDVVDLYRRVHRDGLTAHGGALAVLGRSAARLGADPPLVALLTDDTAPDAIRVRAVARLARQWSALTDAATVADPSFARSFTALLARWTAHQDLRASGGAVAELAASRTRLDAARRSHRAARPGLGSTA